MLDQYVLNKRIIMEILDKVADFAWEKGNGPAASLLKESKTRLAQEDFTLVILGEFKRGKSTLINALLGSQLLPTAIVPLTAIPTVIQYGRQLKVHVIYLDGAKKEISINEIAGYVTERENPENTKRVREVLISYPSELLKQGVILVDTPGVGSVYRHNTNAAYAYLPYSDAAIFTISIDAPLSKNEIDYLKDILKFTNKLFFVLNKIDIASPEDVSEALAYTRETLRIELGEGSYNLIPLSARQALLARTGAGETGLTDSSGIRRLEEILGSFIRNEKGRLILESAAVRALRTINELEMELLLLRKAMESSFRDLDEKIVLLTAKLDKLEREREDSIHLLYREVDRIGDMTGEDLNEFRKAKTCEILGWLEDFHKKESPGKSAKELASSYNGFIKDLIEMVLDEKRNEQSVKVREEFKTVALRFLNRIEEIVDRMLSVSAEIFEIPLEKSASKEYILGSKKFSFHFAEHPSFIPSLETLTTFGLLPKALISAQLLKNAKSKLIELFDRNCGRLRSDLVDSLKEGARDTAGEIRLRADAVSQGLRSALQKALSEASMNEDERRSTEAKWQKEYNELLQMKEALKQFIASL